MRGCAVLRDHREHRPAGRDIAQHRARGRCGSTLLTRFHDGGETQMKLPLRMESKTHARIPWAALTMLPLLSLCASLQAQSMDYGALEQLFKESVTTSVDGSPQRISDAP